MKAFRFRPLLKQTIWGGDKIIPFKHLDSHEQNVGESWEISGVANNETIVSGGTYDGRPLNDVLSELKSSLVGRNNYDRFGDSFPLLIKFIDARQDLSIQVHPTDEIAHRMGLPSGKTEMWYLMTSSSGARLRSGLRKKITPDEYKKMVDDDTICDAIQEYEVKEGDVFFLPAGRIHSIGAGCFLAEIQQTSDATFRIYDFKRRDSEGNYRQLHTEQAAQSIDYTVYNNYRTDYVPQKDRGITLVRCPYFVTTVYDLTKNMTIDYSSLDSFVILIVVGGEGKAVDSEGNEYSLKQGDTLLFPATTNSITVEGCVRFLETYVAP